MKSCARAYDSCSHNNDSHGSAILKAEDRIQKTEFRTPNPTPETANVEPKTRDRPPGKRLRNRLSDKDLGLRPGSGWEAGPDLRAGRSNQADPRRSRRPGSRRAKGMLISGTGH